MYILAIDTSNNALGVAILKDDQLIGQIITNMAKNHSVRLMPAVDQLMKDVQITPEQLEKIVVAQGPGSYTGVRIGLTTAKTLGWALKIPVVGVSSLQALAFQGRFSQSVISPFFDARRGLVYTGLYEWRAGKMQTLLDDRNILLTDWLEKLKALQKSVLFLSPDMEKHQEVILAQLGDLAIIPEEPFHHTSPAYLAYAGKELSGDTVHALKPNYLRLAEAEANWLKAQGEHRQDG
ncbi:tRNA (adenosine(37)-N6)-threonylcarbamoyltransferase complex dimerization subunit type 1 TsaB [Virgibacillus sp. MG-45]|uniref:tRNA (adenosine(37)-N6)-threonylcarbamoyltransferase complex dimerization subunit type 1 TsaB n=1 Tax=Virgibacillus sp. MG-45 TaxID=3102791 RepID=UPI002ED826C2